MTVRGNAENLKGISLKMKYKILLTMILVSLIPLSGLWYISIYKNKQAQTIEIYQNLESAATNLVQKVDQWYTTNLLVLQQNRDTSAIKSMDAALQNPVLTSISSNYRWVYLAFTISPGGNNIGRSDGQPVQSYQDRNYFKQVSEGELVGEEVVMGKTSGKPALILAAPIYDTQRQRNGVLAIAMTLEELSRSLTDISFGKSGYATLIDSKYRVIAKGQKLSTKLENLRSNAVVNKAAVQNGIPFTIEQDGRKVLACSKTTKNGWRILVQEDYEEAFQVVAATRHRAFILLGVTLLVVTGIAFILAAGLAGPIRNLTDVADSMSRGELDVTIHETKRRDEIGALARAIERMGISLQMAFKRMRK